MRSTFVIFVIGLFVISLVLGVNCDLDDVPLADKVRGTCSRPNLPHNARIRFTSPEKVKFAEKENVYFLCEDNQFPHHVQNRTCRYGQWTGPQARCGTPNVSNCLTFS